MSIDKTQAIEDSIEYFYQEYERSTLPVIMACSQGSITIEEQVRQCTKLWNKHLKTATQAINQLISDITTEARKTELEKLRFVIDNTLKDLKEELNYTLFDTAIKLAIIQANYDTNKSIPSSAENDNLAQPLNNRGSNDGNS